MISQTDHPGETQCLSCHHWRGTAQFYVRRTGQVIKSPRCTGCRDLVLLRRLSAACAADFLIPLSDLTSDTRGTADTARARQSVMYFLHEKFGWSHRKIALTLKRDRKTVRDGVLRARSFLTPQRQKGILRSLAQQSDRLAS